MVFSIRLQASDPARNCHRQYSLVVERDLLGDWLVQLSFGRIGTRGRALSTVAADEEDARRLARAILRRRATAPRRIGVAYRMTALFAIDGWAELTQAFASRQRSGSDQLPAANRISTANTNSPNMAPRIIAASM
ncbi:putative DNA-binding WGR domain protein [Sphingomonas vulcanisoli]|uniref:DNA-binding WGR domain protein n=1 Tax=Sphingomonas vulcanisoli TaxID=1658060 RepID=A0ABX0TWI9_9SPHN|nr:WGR domain-containing protein [Sphingomonas vulcanisoli]NIJ09408.1 putative DNA-binding WGR domain protein [Sphingomonas vulcanisoli]